MIETGVACAGSLDLDRAEFHAGWGRAAEAKDIFFDLASLTKVIVTGSLLVDYCLTKSIDLLEFREKKLASLLPHLKAPLSELTVAQLWDHRSGLKPHIELSTHKNRKCSPLNRQEMWESIFKRIHNDGIQSLPDKETIYSDLNFWVLGALLESLSKKDLSQLWEAFKVKYHLPKNDLFFGPLIRNIKVCPTEKRHQEGEVNDDNALFMQQVAPHAGLFGTCAGVWSWLVLMKNWQTSELLSSKVKYYFSPQHTHRFWCGWDRPTGQDTQAGKGASAESVIGHLGYTGTALWWDPALKMGGTLLTNRIYPSHQEASMEEIRHLRVKFFSLLWQNNRRELWKTLADQKSWT